jgi:aspartyl-tRNA synthetase
MEALANATEKVKISLEGSGDSKAEESPSGPSKNALKKAAKEREKERKRLEKANKKAEGSEKEAQESVDLSEGSYGVLPLIQSTTRSGNRPS